MRIQSISGTESVSCLKQGRQTFFHPQVVTVIGGILRDENQLAHARIAQNAGFVDNALYRAADGRALDERDGTKRARTAAAIGHLEIGAGTRDAKRAAHPARPCRRFWLRPADDRAARGDLVLLRTEFAYHLHNIHPATGAKHAVYTGDF